MSSKIDSKARVLVVDDDKINITVLSEALRDEYSVSVATSGAEALRVAAAKPQPDLILLDVNMPNMSGFETCQKLKENLATAEIPVLFVTTQDDISSEAQGFSAGAVDYIHKPIRPVLVRARVALHLRLKLQTEFLARLLDQRSQDLQEAQMQARDLLDYVKGTLAKS